MDYSSPQFWVQVFREGSQKGTRVGVDVDARLTSLTFEDAEKTHKLTIEVDNFDLRHFDSPIFKQGDIIQFSFGYSGDMSPPREAIVTKVTGGIKLKVEALGRDYLMNKELRTRTFNNVKRSDVARQIAREQGYGDAETFIDDTEVTFTTILQARMSDLGLLRQLAQKEGFELYVDATGFHWHRRKLNQKPILTFTYYTVKPEVPQSGMLLSFPSVEIDVTAKPGAVNVVARDPLKKSDIKQRADNASMPGRDVLAPSPELFGDAVSKFGEVTPDAPLESRAASETTVASTATTSVDAKRQAQGMFLKAQQAVVKFKVPAVGNPYCLAKSIVKFDGCGKRLNGNYYLATVTHKITTSGYVMDLDARRDGTSSSVGGTTPQSTGTQNSQDPKKPAELGAVESYDKSSGAFTGVIYK